jgi:hypothetical protein
LCTEGSGLERSDKIWEVRLTDNMGKKLAQGIITYCRFLPTSRFNNLARFIHLTQLAILFRILLDCSCMLPIWIAKKTPMQHLSFTLNKLFTPDY